MSLKLKSEGLERIANGVNRLDLDSGSLINLGSTGTSLGVNGVHTFAFGAGSLVMGSDGTITITTQDGFTRQLVDDDTAVNAANSLVLTANLNAASGFQIGWGVATYHNPSAASSAIVAGIDAGIITPVANAQNISGFQYGVGGYYVHQGSGTATLVTGVSGVVWNGHADLNLGGNGTITKGAVFYAPNNRKAASGTGKFISSYGLYAESQTLGWEDNVGIYLNMPGLADGINTSGGQSNSMFGYVMPAATVNVGNQTATSTAAIGMSLGQITYQRSGGGVTRTITVPATLYVQGAPVAGTGVTFTLSPYAIWSDAGLNRFDGTCQIVADGASQLGFFGTTTAAKQTVTGSKGANAALTSLIAALVAYGMITDSTS